MARDSQITNDIAERLGQIEDHLVEAIQDISWVTARHKQFQNDVNLFLRGNCLSDYISAAGELHTVLGDAMRLTHHVCRTGTLACQNARDDQGNPSPIAVPNQIGSTGEKD